MSSRELDPEEKAAQPVKAAPSAPRTLPVRAEEPKTDQPASTSEQQAKGSSGLLPPAQHTFDDDDEDGRWGNLPVQMRHYEDGTPAS